MKLFAAIILSTILFNMSASYAAENDIKIGFVNTEKLRESKLALEAQKRLEKEFKKREEELQDLEKKIKDLESEIQKNDLTMSDTVKRTKQRELTETTKEFQRKQREFREDVDQRRHEELRIILDRANKVIKSLAESEKIDIIFQEAVYVSPRIDITEKVIKAIDASVTKP